MKGSEYDIENSNPVRLADNTVLALSSLERGAGASPESLSEGIRLCDYLMLLLRTRSSSQESREATAIFPGMSDGAETLAQSLSDVSEALGKTEQVKQYIDDLIRDPASHTSVEIQDIKKHLIILTMPMWRRRASEFRERKMKRSLTLHE